MGVIGADGVDVGTFGDVVAIEDGLGGSGCGVDDVGAAYGLGGGSSGVYRDAEAVGHFGAEVCAALWIAAVNAGGFELSRGGDGFELGSCLAARAEDGGCPRVLAGKIFCGDAGSGSGALLAHEIGFD